MQERRQISVDGQKENCPQKNPLSSGAINIKNTEVNQLSELYAGFIVFSQKGASVPDYRLTVQIL